LPRQERIGPGSTMPSLGVSNGYIAMGEYPKYPL